MADKEHQQDSTDGENSRNMNCSGLIRKKKGKKVYWNDCETKILLDNFQELQILEQLDGTRRDSKPYGLLTTALVSCGVKKTQTQIINKIKKLRDSYKDVVDHNNVSGNDFITCPYYEQLDEIYGHRSFVNPSNIMQAGLQLRQTHSPEARDSESQQEGSSSHMEPVSKNMDRNYRFLDSVFTGEFEMSFTDSEYDDFDAFISERASHPLGDVGNIVTDQTDRSGKSNKNERGAKANRTDEDGQSNKNERGAKADKDEGAGPSSSKKLKRKSASTASVTDQTDGGGKSNKNERGAKANRTDEDGRSNQNERGAKANRTDEDGQSNKNERGAKADKDEGAGPSSSKKLKRKSAPTASGSESKMACVVTSLEKIQENNMKMLLEHESQAQKREDEILERQRQEDRAEREREREHEANMFKMLLQACTQKKD